MSAKTKDKPKTERPKAIEVLNGKRTRKTIAIAWRQGEGTFDLDERDNPLPSLPKALDALAAVAGEVLHVPEAWWKENFRVIGVVFSEQGGAGAFQLICRKSFADASKEFAFTTPPRLLAHPTEPGSYTPPVSKESIAAVEEAREQFKLYVRGDRAQGLIQFDEEESDEEDDGSGAEPKQGTLIELPAKKRGAKKEATAAK